MIKVNGKKVSEKKAQEIIDDKNKIVTEFSMSYPQPNPTEEPSHDGFDIPQDYISEMSKTMDRMGAEIATLRVEKSPKIKGRTMYLIMLDDDSKFNEKITEALKE